METPWLLTTCSPEVEHAAIFLNMNAEKTLESGKSLTNAQEACVVMALVEALTEVSEVRREVKEKSNVYF